MTVTGPKICLMLLTIKINIIMRFIKNLKNKEFILKVASIIITLLSSSFLISTLFVHTEYENTILNILLWSFIILILINSISIKTINNMTNIPNIVQIIFILLLIPVISIIIVSVPTYLIIMAITHHSIKLGILFVCSIIIILYYMMRAEN